MLYNWECPIPSPEGTKEFYNETDYRFFNALKKVAHPDFPDEIPFNRLIDYQSLKEKKILEIGCGSGVNAAIFASLGIDITAVDITEKAIDLTQKRFKVFGLRGKILRVDAEKMTFENESFDYVWSWGVIHHTANIQNAISEIYRVLKYDGRAQIMVYNRNSFRYWLLGGLYYGIIKGRIFRMSLEEVNKSFTDGYIARHLTKREARQLFSMFNMKKFMILDQGDHFLPFGKVNRVLEKVIPEKIFSKIDVFFMRRFGWFLFIDVVK